MQQPGRAAEIKAIGIGKSFGSFRALNDLTLDIGRGEFLTLLGPSGSGKTTFLMILAGFVQPSEGRLFSDGVDITDRPAEQRAAGMVFQGYALFPHMSVEANIAFPLKVRKKSAAEIKRRVGEMIERVGLNGHEKKLPAQLSGGQQQRVALARALVFEPGVLLARRAVLGARQGPARPDAGRDEAAAPGDRHHLRLRHPRPERGAGAVVARRHLQPWRIAAGRRAGGGLRPAGQPLRRSATAPVIRRELQECDLWNHCGQRDDAARTTRMSFERHPQVLSFRTQDSYAGTELSTGYPHCVERNIGSRSAAMSSNFRV